MNMTGDGLRSVSGIVPKVTRLHWKTLQSTQSLRNTSPGSRCFPATDTMVGHLDGKMVKETFPRGVDWIGFPARGGPFSEQTMMQLLLELLSEKKNHYGIASGFDHLSLVIHYSSALLYNSPVKTPRFTFENAVEAARQFLDDDAEPFQSIYLFVAIVDHARVFKVCLVLWFINTLTYFFRQLADGPQRVSTFPAGPPSPAG